MGLPPRSLSLCGPSVDVERDRRGSSERQRSPCRLRPVVPHVDLERNQLDRPVSSQLADDGIGTHKHAGRDQHAVVAPPRDEFDQIIEAGRETFDDLLQLECLEVVGRRLPAQSTFIAKLAIKVLEELERRADLATFATHPR